MYSHDNRFLEVLRPVEKAAVPYSAVSTVRCYSLHTCSQTDTRYRIYSGTLIADIEYTLYSRTLQLKSLMVDGWRLL